MSNATPTAAPPVVDRADIVKVLAASALVAVPISIAAYLFTQLVNNAQDGLWSDLPDALGFATVPWWWPIPLLLVGGALLCGVLLFIPGRAGHPPAAGFSLDGMTPAIVIPVLLGALACLPFGAVLGPEAPLTVLGAGGAVWLARLLRVAPVGQIEALIILAGAGAAVSTILGNPIVAIVFMVEAVAAANGPVKAAIVPVMTSIGIGALIFTGLGSISGVEQQTLTAPPFKGDVSLDAADLLYAVPVGLIAGIAMTIMFAIGTHFADRAAHSNGRRLVILTMSAAILVSLCAAAYALITDRSPQEIASSGTATMGVMLSAPAVWGIGTLVAVLVFKALGYTISLGLLRGGPIFPGVFLGVAFGVMVSPLPGFGLAAAVSASVAAFTAAGMRLPLSAAALALLMFGGSAPDQVPVIVVAAVIGYLVRTIGERALTTRQTARSAIAPDKAAATSPVE